MHKTLIFRPIPPFEIGPLNVNSLTLFQPSLPLPQTVPFCYACDSTPSNITNRPKHLDSSKTVTHVARVMKPFRETPVPDTSYSLRGCRCFLGPKTPLQLFCLLCEPLPPLPSPPPPEPRQSQPGPRPFRTLPRAPPPSGGERTAGGGVEIGLDSPSAPAIIARPYARAREEEQEAEGVSTFRRKPGPRATLASCGSPSSRRARHPPSGECDGS